MTMVNLVKIAFDYAGKKYKVGDIFVPQGFRNDRSILENLTRSKFVEQEEMTVKELREKLKELGLSTNGSKADLLIRLQEAQDGWKAETS